MNRVRRLLVPLFLAALMGAIWPLTAFAALDPGLGTSGSFAVLSGSILTNTGPTWITGQIGVSPSIGVPPHITGFPPGTSGTQHDNDGVAAGAQAAEIAAYGRLVPPTQPACTTIGPDLTGLTEVPGDYCVAAAATNLTGTLTLNGNGVFVFEMTSTLITSDATGATVNLIGGAAPCQVFWRVPSSATIGASTAMVGNILAATSISMNDSATLNGRAFAQTGAVTLIHNRIIQAAGCTYAAPTFVAPPAGNTFGSGALAPSSPILGAPATGVPEELLAEFPWLLVVGVGSAVAMVMLTVSTRRRRRRNT